MLGTKQNNTFGRLCLAASISVILTACGGGGGSDAAPTTPTTPTTPPTPVVDLPTEFGTYLTDLSTNHILPSYQAMQTTAQSLREQSVSFCALASPTNADLVDFQQSWSDFNLAWQAIQWVKVGAVVEENRLFRIQFWPDANDAVSRGVESLLLEQQTVTAELVASQNVGGQGIPALEYLLYPSDTNNSLLNASNKDKRCEVSQAIAENLLTLSTEINTAWQPSGGDYQAQLVNGTGDFTSVQDAIEELVTNWLEAIELVKDEKSLLPLGTGSPGIFDITEHRLSEQSLASIAVNLQSFQTLYTNGNGRGFDAILTDTLQQQTISDQMSTAVESTIARINQINSDFDSYQTLLADEDGRAQLTVLIDELRTIRDVLTTGFVQALDINIGFNSNDGD